MSAAAAGARTREGRGQQPTALVGARSGFARPADCSARSTRDVARNRGWSDRVAQGAVFGRWHGSGRRADRGPRGADLAERGRADGFRGVDGLGHPAEDGAGATAGQDRRRGRRRRGEITEDRRSGRRRRGAKAAITSPAGDPATPTDDSRLRWLAESRENAASAVLKRLDAPRIEKFHRRRK